MVNINDKPACALVDSGSLGDFISGSLVDQLQLKKHELDKSITVQLAAQGSKTKVSYGATPSFEYQGIKTERYFDIMNIHDYDVILGTPWLYQHEVSFGLNPPSVIIGSTTAKPLEGSNTIRLQVSAATVKEQDNLETHQCTAMHMFQPLFCDPNEVPLPPLHEINHRIPLIDERKKYPWRPARCPEALRPLWNEKREAYLRTGKWKMTMAANMCLLMIIPKPSKPGEPLCIHIVSDLRPRNENTVKMASPLPVIEGVYRRVASCKYKSIIDISNAFEQQRVEPEDIAKTAVNTPDGNMVSLVVQQGDCNAPASFQALMCHILAPHLGICMDAYLDDIVIYSNSIEQHMLDLQSLQDILLQAKLYLNDKKVQFFAKELKILGRVISKKGIRMDPDKVDSLAKWKTPTNRDLLRGFLGVAGYLADDIDRIQIPMGKLFKLTKDSVLYRWTDTH